MSCIPSIALKEFLGATKALFGEVLAWGRQEGSIEMLYYIHCRGIRTMFFFSLLFATGILRLPMPVDAATYYVATNGNDANPGTQASPFQTLQKAADNANTGDTVQVGPGTYYERVRMNKSGITFEGAGNRQSIIDGSDAKNNQIVGNHIHDGLVGIKLDESDGTKILGNTIHHFSAEGIFTFFLKDTAEIGGNLLYDSDHNIRLQNLQSNATMYIYANRFHEPI